MIIESLCNMILNIIMLIFTPFHLPDLPPDIVNSCNQFIDTIIAAAGSLIDFVIPLDTPIFLLKTLLVIIGVVYGYKLIMWILGKIPTLNIH